MTFKKRTPSKPAEKPIEVEASAEVDETLPIEEAPEPTLGDLLGGAPFLSDAEPVMPGFEMDDDPLPTPLGRSYIEATNQRAATQDIYGNPVERNDGGTGGSFQSYAADGGLGQGGAAGVPEVLPGDPGPPVLDGEIIAASRPGSPARYESRIRILDAWQYRGQVATAPAYVDRNWIGYASDPDTLRGLEAGPCLRVPISPDPSERVVVICRVGDYVVHEEIVGNDGGLSEKIEVWEQGQFQRLFLPKQAVM